MKTFDWSRAMVEERWEGGRRDIERALDALSRHGPAAPGELVVHEIRGADPSDPR